MVRLIDDRVTKKNQKSAGDALAEENNEKRAYAKRLGLLSPVLDEQTPVRRAPPPPPSRRGRDVIISLPYPRATRRD